MNRSPRLERYRNLVEDDLLAQVYHAAEPLVGQHVVHFNTTAQGGGVAELLHSLIPLMQELGIPHSWKVVPLDNASNRFTAQIVGLLQSMEHGDIAKEDQRGLLDTLRHAPVMQHKEESQADIYFVHDFQLAPLAKLFSWMRPAIWMCHVDTANPDPNGKAYIEQFLDAYNVCVFNTPLSIFKGLPPGKGQVVTPTIDPFSDKNRALGREEGLKMMADCGIDTNCPLITQVSRFGDWKNPWQVIDIYRAVKRQIPNVQAALVGAMEAADDVEAVDILKDVQKKAGNDPKIHLLSDPAKIKHPQVNAFQRYSSVILQRSTREGFGLTVTEAMWKDQPVVGTSVTGLRTQISDGENGFIADDTQTAAQRTVQLIQDRALWQKLGKAAHKSVKDNYLLPMMALEYLNALSKACGRAR